MRFTRQWADLDANKICASAECGENISRVDPQMRQASPRDLFNIANVSLYFGPLRKEAKIYEKDSKLYVDDALFDGNFWCVILKQDKFVKSPWNQKKKRFLHGVYSATSNDRSKALNSRQITFLLILHGNNSLSFLMMLVFINIAL